MGDVLSAAVPDPSHGVGEKRGGCVGGVLVAVGLVGEYGVVVVIVGEPSLRGVVEIGLVVEVGSDAGDAHPASIRMQATSQPERTTGRTRRVRRGLF